MQIRFFNDWAPGPEHKERLLIGLAADDDDRGQAREAVRVATPEDVDNYPVAYEAYLASFETGEGSGALAPEQASSEGMTFPLAAVRDDPRLAGTLAPEEAPQEPGEGENVDRS